MLHEVRDGVLPIADALLKLGRDEGDGLGLVEAEASGETLLGEESCLREDRVRLGGFASITAEAGDGT